MTLTLRLRRLAGYWNANPYYTSHHVDICLQPLQQCMLRVTLNDDPIARHPQVSLIYINYHIDYIDIMHAVD